MWLLYQALIAALTMLVGPFLLIRRGRHYLRSLSGRLGHVPVATGPVLWVHAVSVGEVNVATSLAPILPTGQDLLVTTVTPSGQDNARGKFPGALITFLPFELAFAVHRFFERLKPAALILCEGDLWPLVLREASRRGIPVVMINGRISERSFRRMRVVRRFLTPILEPVDGFAVQTLADRQRLESLGVEPDKITVTGNLKFETAAPAEIPELEAAIGALADGRPILVAGSTMRGEEEKVLEAFRRIGGDRAFLVLAPRHPERWPRVAARLDQQGTRAISRSKITSAGIASPPSGEPVDVLLLDSLGELASIYRLSRAVFIGGTLVPTGGHNPLEAARQGVAISAGPSMHNFKEIADRFDEDQAWQRVNNAEELAVLWDRWLRNSSAADELGARGARLVESNRGAFTKTEAFLRAHMGEVLHK